MIRFIWRLRFAWAVNDIFSRPKGAFTGNSFKLGWEISKNMDMSLQPRQAAIEEITRWYFE